MSTNFKLFIICLCVPAFVFAQQPEPIPDQYIVVLKESAAQPVKKQEKRNNNREQKAAANKPARDRALAKVKAIHEKLNINSSAIISEFTEIIVGFSAKLNAQEKQALENDPEVEAVIQDYVIEIGPMNTEPDPSDIGFMENKLQGNNFSNNSGPFESLNHESIDLPAQYVGCNITNSGGLQRVHLNRLLYGFWIRESISIILTLTLSLNMESHLFSCILLLMMTMDMERTAPVLLRQKITQ